MDLPTLAKAMRFMIYPIEELTYTDGYITACEEWEEYRFDVKDALYAFAIDPADSEFQKGYRDALLSMDTYGNFVHTPPDSNVTYVMWRPRECM